MADLRIGRRTAVLAAPAHPYTAGLLASSPSNHAPGSPLTPIAGQPPNLQNLPSGCAYHPRCPYVMDVCRETEPPLLEPMPGRRVACHLVP